MRILVTIAALSLLTACASSSGPSGPAQPQTRPTPPVVVPTSTPAPPAVGGLRMPEIMEGAGLGGIIQANAASLQQRFGTPRLDVREGDMRKLQFTGQACVLDVFLYPLSRGAEPVATWVEARRASDGAEVSRLDCVLALSR